VQSTVNRLQIGQRIIYLPDKILGTILSETSYFDGKHLKYRVKLDKPIRIDYSHGRYEMEDEIITFSGSIVPIGELAEAIYGL
jgi:hypothetical protein